MTRSIALSVLALSGLVLASCSLSPIGGTSELDMTTTGSIAPAAPAPAVTETPLAYGPAAEKPKSATDGVEPADWEAIRLFVSTNLDQAKIGDVLDWTNNETGSNGTISPLAARQAASQNRQCRAFALTISDVRGIRRYRGDACHTPDGMWQLFDMTPEDQALL